jgi:hypothetical protein
METGSEQEALGQQIAARMRDLGITTILRGFEGNVPGQIKVSSLQYFSGDFPGCLLRMLEEPEV